MHLTESTFRLTKIDVVALLRWMSADATHPNVYGLCVDPRARCVFSTDGHRLLRARDVRSDAKAIDAAPFIVPHPAIKQAHRVMGKHDSLEVSVEGNIFEVLHAPPDDTPTRRTSFEYKRTPRHVPPRHEVVVPQFDSAKRMREPVALDPRYLGDLAVVGRALTPVERSVFVRGKEKRTKIPRPLIYQPNKPLEPQMFYSDDGAVEWCAVIMPLRM